MNQTLVCDTQAAMGMKIDSEFVVVALSSGKFFHFTAESEAFFQAFQTPQTVSQYATQLSLAEHDKKYLENFCAFLLKENILAPCAETSEKPAVAQRYVPPKLLRQGDKLLSECEFSYP